MAFGEKLECECSGNKAIRSRAPQSLTEKRPSFVFLFRPPEL
jgi:hypothetical protein